MGGRLLEFSNGMFIVERIGDEVVSITWFPWVGGDLQMGPEEVGSTLGRGMCATVVAPEGTPCFGG